MNIMNNNEYNKDKNKYDIQEQITIEKTVAGLDNHRPTVVKHDRIGTLLFSWKEQRFVGRNFS